MKIKYVDFMKSVAIDTKQVIFDKKPEILFVGRSNVGKSSIMNSIFDKKDMVKTSSRPGKTVTANLFSINKGKVICTDLPGYGFARLGKDHMDKLDALISWYIEEVMEKIKRVVVLIDCRIGIQDSDISMYNYLTGLSIPMIVVVNKIDKLKQGEANKVIAHTEALFKGQRVIGYSSLKKTNHKELLREIFEGIR